jgi:predicted O-methyltransferase YrrM
MMDTQLADLLREIEDTSHQHGEPPRIARESGQFLNILLKAMGARNILEVGTADGYATLWLADAAAANDGLVTTIEHDVWRIEIARGMFERSPHRDRIKLVQGNALELLSVLEGPFDFVLLDAEKSEALRYFQLLFERVRSGALICCDKALSKASQLADYLTYVHERPGLESVLAPIGEGLELTYKTP